MFGINGWCSLKLHFDLQVVYALSLKVQPNNVKNVKRIQIVFIVPPFDIINADSILVGFFDFKTQGPQSVYLY